MALTGHVRLHSSDFRPCTVTAHCPMPCFVCFSSLHAKINGTHGACATPLLRLQALHCDSPLSSAGVCLVHPRHIVHLGIPTEVILFGPRYGVLDALLHCMGVDRGGVVRAQQCVRTGVF